MPSDEPLRCKHHRHKFHGLYYHFGPFGRQDVHVHPCLNDDCARVLIGTGRECSGDAADHHRETLT